MKLTFEGTYYEDILTQMANVLAATARQSRKINPDSVSENADITAIPPQAVSTPDQGPGPAPAPPEKAPVDKPLDKPLDNPADTPEEPEVKSKKPRTPKQLENDERLRAAAKAKAEAAKPPTKEKAPAAAAKEPEPSTPTLDPAEVVRIRQKTIDDLQAAYANGFQKQVFDLLSRFGNGAKSFRELPPDAFVPIREAIDSGALT